MKSLRRLLGNSWKILFFLNGLVTMVLLFPFFYVLLSRETWFPHAMKLKRFWAHLLLFDVGIIYSVKQLEKLDKKQTYIFCPNHSSYLDIVVSYVALPNYFHFVGKAELRKVPLFGIFFKDMDIAIDRANIRNSLKALGRASSDIDKGISIAIFPEGTIPETAPQLGNFKNGPFKLAIEKQVPIVPVTYLNNWKILPDVRKGKKPVSDGGPGKARVIIHKPIETKGLSEDDIETLKKQVYEVIEGPLKEVI